MVTVALDCYCSNSTTGNSLQPWSLGGKTHIWTGVVQKKKQKKKQAAEKHTVCVGISVREEQSNHCSRVVSITGVMQLHAYSGWVGEPVCFISVDLTVIKHTEVKVPTNLSRGLNIWTSFKKGWTYLLCMEYSSTSISRRSEDSLTYIDERAGFWRFIRTAVSGRGYLSIANEN